MKNCYSCDAAFPFVKDDFCHKCGSPKTFINGVTLPNQLKHEVLPRGFEKPMTKTITASDLALAAADTLKDRASERDTPEGERSMKRCVAIYKAWIGIDLTEEQGWQFMTALKMARSAQGKPKDDDYIDRAGYAALEGECALRDRTSLTVCIVCGQPLPTRKEKPQLGFKRADGKWYPIHNECATSKEPIDAKTN